MPSISKEKTERIQEQIISFLYLSFPKLLFNSEISQELARDEEFIKKLLLDLEKKHLVSRVSKNSKGTPYSRRIRWILTTRSYEIYKKAQLKKVEANQILEKNFLE